jgi:hypothetical protein
MIKIGNEEPHASYFSLNIIKIIIKKDKMGRARSADGEINAYKILARKPEG